MSRQNKQAKNNKRAAEFSAIRKSGGHGPAKTQRKHAKQNVNHRDPEVKAARAAVLFKSREARKDKP